jgi:hypothetical protein
VPEPSILEKRAQARKISEYLDAQPDTQAELYCDTLIEMSIFLATGILIKLTRDFTEVLLKDVIRIIKALLFMQSAAERPKMITTIDGVLEKLILAKDHFQIAYNMYGNDQFIPASKSKKFLVELGEARKSINEALKHFDGGFVKESKTRISVELLKQK